MYVYIRQNKLRFWSKSDEIWYLWNIQNGKHNSQSLCRQDFAKRFIFENGFDSGLDDNGEKKFVFVASTKNTERWVSDSVSGQKTDFPQVCENKMWKKNDERELESRDKKNCDIVLNYVSMP